jgi:hypothetical protein
MRENDIINDNECAYLHFTKVPLLTKYGVRPIILPCCFYAGKIQSVTDAGIAPNHATRIVLQEMWSMLLALLCQLKFLPREETDSAGNVQDAMETLSGVKLLPKTVSQYHLETRGKMVKAVKVRNICTTAIF